MVSTVHFMGAGPDQAAQRPVLRAGAFLAATLRATGALEPATLRATTLRAGALAAGFLATGALTTSFCTDFLAATFLAATFLAATFLAAGLGAALVAPDLGAGAAFFAGAFLAAAFFAATGLVVAALRAVVVLPEAFLGLTGASSTSSIGSEALTRPPRTALAFGATGFSPQISSSW